MKQVAPNKYFSVMPNAGWPEEVGGRIMYPAGPEYFGEYALAFRHAGANMIGGCCGTTPQHILAMHKSIQSTPIEQFTNGLRYERHRH
jgi:methionine synthase / methylenetetrahydrofolate reductase(NADPH)